MANDNKITLLDWIEKNPREYTYFALGSAPRYTEMSKFTAEIDQIYPRFLRKVNKTIRIIHFDQLFERDDNFAFLYEYFDSLGFNHSMINNMNCWTSDDHIIEVFIIPQNMDIMNELPYIYDMVKHHIKYNSYFVFQEYFGFSNGPVSLVKLHRQIYDSIIDESQKNIYKNKVLFDITYGEAHCLTNMEMSEPFVNMMGDFINLSILVDNERLQYIGINQSIDSHFINEYSKMYRDIINTNHYMYRSSNDSMHIEKMKEQLEPVIFFLKKLNIITSEKEETMIMLFNNLSTIDKYKWVQNILSLI